MIKRVLLPIAILAIALFIFITLKQTKPEKVVSQKPEKIWRVSTVPVVFKNISPEITLYGHVETPTKATLKSALAAKVMLVDVLEGTVVNKGQKLITLDDTDVQLLLKQRQADLAEVNALINSENERFKRDKDLLKQEQELLLLAEKSVSRAKKLEKTRLASQSSLDDAMAAKQRQILTVKRLHFDIVDHSARLAQLDARKQRNHALLQQAEVDLNRTQIIAPFSGRISLLNVAVGDRVRVGDSLLSLYAFNDLEVRAQIPGRYLDQVHRMLMNHEPLLATATVAKQNYSFSLKRLSGEVKVDSGGIDGLFDLSTKKESLTLGSFVEMDLKLAPQNNVFSAPYNALYGLDHVYKLEKGYLQAVNIERVGEYTAENGDKKLLIRSKNLKQGDQIISTQLPNAMTGLRVEAVSE